MNNYNNFSTNIRHLSLWQTVYLVRAWATGFALLLGIGGIASAAVIPDVRNTTHNLSTTGPGTVKATSETQVCVFCHTPHAATTGIVAPLWNRALSSATYTPYASSSTDASAAELAAGPGGSSKLCLSCHDGTLAIGNVNVLNGQASASIDMAGTAAGKMPDGTVANTGFTRNLGVDMSNDHPISFTYDDALADADGEIRRITGQSAVGNRVAGVNPKPQFPLENGQMQCATCHDPHIRETDTSKGNLKFLRGNRFQQAQPAGGTFDANNDIMCLACHDKGGTAYALSTHASQSVSTQTYKDAEADKLGFPRGMPVWKASCLNCHDTHTVPGARRLIREGTDGSTYVAGVPPASKVGGNAALEQVCIRCHANAAESIITVTTPGGTIPNIKDEIKQLYRMSMESLDQGTTDEKHDIGSGKTEYLGLGAVNTQLGKDFVEAPSRLGKGGSSNNYLNRHAECTDCHYPHRIVKNEKFSGLTSVNSAGTHTHTNVSGAAGTKHTNIASGVLRGTTGVEPIYSSNSFHTMPSDFILKRGDPGSNTSELVTEPYVTREYQVCLKCHSNYGHDDNNIYPVGNRPLLGGAGSTLPGLGGMTMYTNIAKEFQAPVSHRGEFPVGTGMGTDGGAGGYLASGAFSSYNNENHRSWHPVMDKTGRTAAQRGMASASSFLPPWNNDLGNQTMYCVDCHGDNVASLTSVIPDNGTNGNPWGPHGSNNPFLLKGVWVDKTSNEAHMVCFKCHKKSTYDGGSSSSDSGFSGPFNNNLHSWHADKVGRMRCSWCHAQVPHGWKNKNLLVNLNDVGEEAGYPGRSMEVSLNGDGDYYTKEPYYFKAIMKFRTFSSSGNWQANDCASSNKVAADRVNGSRGSTNDGTTDGKDWMKNICKSAP